MTAMDLSSFLRLGTPPALKLCLPRFAGTAREGAGFSYPGFLHADRDVRSAQEVERLACTAGADTQLISPDEAISALNQHKRFQPLVIFGSRSNDAFPTVVSKSRLSELVTFSFSDEWTITTRGGVSYSLKDPSRLDRVAYTAATDYGVVAGLVDEGYPTVFIVAGLGGRATEGCGRFLRESWTELARRSEGKSFAALLRFDPPVDPNDSEMVEFIHLKGAKAAVSRRRRGPL